MKGGRRSGAGTVAKPWDLAKIRKYAYRLHGTACVYSRACGGPGKALEVDCEHFLPLGPGWEIRVQQYGHGKGVLRLEDIADPATRRRFERDIAEMQSFANQQR